MCATKRDCEDFRSVVLHRNELHGKPLSPHVHWLLDQCSESTEDSCSGLFTRLPPNPNILLFDRQNYQQWKAQYEVLKFSHPFRMRRRSILIQPLSYSSSMYPLSTIETDILLHLREYCRAFFMGMEIIVADPVEISELRKITKRIHSETGREQILIDDLMKYLKVHKRNKVFCAVGVTIVDLYPGPEWNFSLGHASLTEGVAICSFGRYFNSRVTASLPSLQQQLENMWILVKVLTHELCHVFGLSHCYYFHCCMNESLSIEEASKQPLFLCPVCLRKLQNVLKFDIAERYKALAIQLECISLKTTTNDFNNSASSHFTNALKWLQTCLNNF